MKCPLCGGGFDTVNLKTIDGSGVEVKHCDQCGGFWFEREPTEFLSLESIAAVDAPTPNYSLKSSDLVCANDNSLLTAVDRDDMPAGSQYWRCLDCTGTFFPKGQLALITHWQHDNGGHRVAGLVTNRARTSLAVLLLVIGGIMVNGVIQKPPTFSAATEQVLPTSGPNILTLLLLGLAYLAGTILAVLGRRLTIILVGWAVIIICLIAFSIIIFGP